MKKIFGLLSLIPAISLANTVTHDITHIDRSNQANTVSSSEENGVGWLNTYINNTDIDVKMLVASNRCWSNIDRLHLTELKHQSQMRIETTQDTHCGGKALEIYFCKKGQIYNCFVKTNDDGTKKEIGSAFLGSAVYTGLPTNWVQQYDYIVTTYDMYGNKVDESPKNERDLTITLEQQYNDPNGDYRVRVRKGHPTPN